MSNQIHPTAILDPTVRLGEGVRIGPYCVVGPDVTLGDNVVLHSHVAIMENTSLGDRVQVFPFAVLGAFPQIIRHHWDGTRVEVGADTHIREHVTIQRGTNEDKGVTSVGSQTLLMVGSHVAHDCNVGNHVVMANNATLAGHVVVEDYANIGGLSAVRQFVRIGRNAMIGGMSGIEHDVLPFSLVQGERASLRGLNLVGLKRRGFSKTQVAQMREILDLIFSAEGTKEDRLRAIESLNLEEAVRPLVTFLKKDTSRGLCGPATSCETVKF